ncbi:type II toxin-antitoxin system RelE/ParE family toxin [Desulfobacula sp.]|uniref:type II toxin-antitoxin system RelE/ParE family toxin n=1 Tax=Desulfobacula sp. TaxID=2593537 RepID=UPI0027154A81|nr:type II toxin-antitoxin system RelE/ParE family toxin [Desulfobacula sp.]
MKYELRSSKQYDKWFTKLKDSSIKIKVLARLDRVENGNFGDFKQIGSNLFELRFFFGSGLRIYYTIQEGRVLLLLAGGDKSTQSKDIERAAELLNELED